jgi:epoxyqueuosine reductase
MSGAEETRRIVGQARALGFELCGVAPAAKFPELAHLPEWLGRGYAGEMGYLHNPKRESPERALAGARSVIVCAMNYNTPLPYSVEARAEFQSDPQPRGWISRYAWGDDYHEVLGARLEKLVTWMSNEFAEPHQSLWYVDTGPIVERIAAKWAGLGWLGKNTCLINKDWGSWLFLGVVITTLDLPPSLANDSAAMRDVGANLSWPAHGRPTASADAATEGGLSESRTPVESLGLQKPEKPVPTECGTPPALEPLPDLCGQCTLCIDACPTGALVEPYVMDARRCISYLTIELRGAIPAEFHDAIGWHIFGCDICQDVCPYNRRAPVTGNPAFLPRDVPGYAPPLAALSGIDEAQFHATFAHSPVRRTKPTGLRRNCLLADALGRI